MVQVVQAIPENGAGKTTLQVAYDNDPTGAQILLDNVPNPLTVQASVAGEVFSVLDVGGLKVLEVDSNPDTIVMRAGVTIEDSFPNAGALNALVLSDTYTQTGAFVGGGILSIGTVTTGVSTTWVWALLQESKLYRININPAFAAFTLFNALAVIENEGNFNLPQALVLNAGLAHRRRTAGTSTTAQTVVVSSVPNTRTLVSGAVMTKTTGDTGLRHAPTFGTVAGSTVNMGTQRGLHCVNPAVGLFQPGAGVENLTAYIGVEIDAIPFGGNVTKRGIRSALAAATNTRFLESTGSAESDHLGPFNLDGDFPNGLLRQGASLDYVQGWVNTNEFFQQIVTPAVTQWRHSAPSAGRLLVSGAGAALSEYNLNTNRFSFGASSGAVGNQVGNFVTPARTIGVAGEWADFLLTQGGNLTVGGLSMSRVSAWVINGISYASSSGTVSNADTLTVGGFPTSAPGVTITERQSIHVIGGRSRFQSAMQFDPISPAALALGNNNNYAGLLTGSANNNMRHWVRLVGDAGGSTITGIDATAVQDGDTFELTNVGANTIDIAHQSASSTAGNRIISPTGATYQIAADETVLVRYDATTGRWRLLGGTGA